MGKNGRVVLDVQRSAVHRLGDDAQYLARLRGAVEAARAAEIPVLHVVVGFRAGHPEASTRNKMLNLLSAFPGGIGYASDDPGAGIHPDVAPLPADLVVTRTRLGGFAGSDLDVLLR